MHHDPNSPSYRQMNRDDEQRRRIWGWTIGIVAAVIAIVGLISYLANKQRLASDDIARQRPESVSEAPTTPSTPSTAPITPPATEPVNPNAPTTPSPDMSAENPAVPGTSSDVVPADAFVVAPDTYVGKQVSLDGKIDQVLSPQAFIMHHETVAPDQKFLIILPALDSASTATQPALQVDQAVTVNGSVMTYDATQAQAMAANADKAALDAYTGKVMIMANAAPTAH